MATASRVAMRAAPVAALRPRVQRRVSARAAPRAARFRACASSAPSAEKLETAVFAMGWFWGPEEGFSGVEGVVSTRVGYTGGDRPDPTYGSVCAGDGHTEALKVEFDPSVVSYEALLGKFLSVHDPCVSMTTQYQSAVWPQNEAQKDAVLRALDELEARRGRPVYTKVEPPKRFHDAEWYHRQYNKKNKARLAAAAGVFLLNNAPHGSFPGQEQLKTVLGGAVFLSLLPQLVAPFDKILAVFD